MKGFLLTFDKDKINAGSSFVDSENSYFFLKGSLSSIVKGPIDGTPAANIYSTVRLQGGGIDIDAFEYYLKMYRGDEL